jgi:hypothetical protein
VEFLIMAGETYWTYQAATSTPTLAEAIEAGAVKPDTSEAAWNSLTPGMRREIVRSARKH